MSSITMSSMYRRMLVVSVITLNQKYLALFSVSADVRWGEGSSGGDLNMRDSGASFLCEHKIVSL
jgi:hypothetical protein